MQVGVLRLCKDKCTSNTCASTFSLALISCFSLLWQADSSTCRIVKTFVHLSVSHSTVFWEYFVFQNFHVLIFCVDKVLYKWTYGTKNCWSTKIVSVWVLVCLLLFRLARNHDNEANLDPRYYIIVTLWLSGVIVDRTIISRPRYWPGWSLVNADTEIHVKASWDLKDHFWVSNSSESTLPFACSLSIFTSSYIS